jgi:hypothetical protein
MRRRPASGRHGRPRVIIVADQAPDVATGQRIRHHPDDRITQGDPPLALLCAPIRETGIGAAAPQDCRSLRVDLYDAGAAVDGDDLSVA